jgi:hypothetical protein
MKKVELEKGRVKRISGSMAYINVKGKIITANIPIIDCILRENQVVMVSKFNGQYRIIG